MFGIFCIALHYKSIFYPIHTLPYCVFYPPQTEPDLIFFSRLQTSCLLDTI